jgi:hypothetical protein
MPRSDFSKTLAQKGLAEAGAYLLNDNGHINQRTESFVNLASKQKVSPLARMQSSAELGPGQYETAISDFNRKKLRAQVQQKSGSQSLQPGMRVSIPTIPNKFLTPIIDYSSTKEQSALLIHTDSCNIAKLIDDSGARVGPGSYSIEHDVTRKSRPSGLRWETTLPTKQKKLDECTMNLGPGTYTIRETDTKPKSMFLPREGLRSNENRYPVLFRDAVA